MNRVVLTGRLTKDPEVRYGGENNTAIASFTLAVNRRFVNKDNPNAPTADFIRCMTFGKTAEFVEKYFHKGQKADLEGRIQTGSYQNKDGQTVYTTDVVVENIEFGESKNAVGGGTSSNGTSSNRTSAVNTSNNTQQFINIPEGIDEQLPFN